jgi:hypothetical protein
MGEKRRTKRGGIQDWLYNINVPGTFNYCLAYGCTKGLGTALTTARLQSTMIQYCNTTSFVPADGTYKITTDIATALATISVLHPVS